MMGNLPSVSISDSSASGSLIKSSGSSSNARMSEKCKIYDIHRMKYIGEVFRLVELLNHKKRIGLFFECALF